MIKPKFAHCSWLQRTTGVAIALLLPSLLMFSGIAGAEAPVPEVRHFPAEAVAVPQQSTELKIYKQSFEVSADVRCRVPKKGPSYCTVNIGSEISNEVEPEMILKYTSIRLDEQEFVAESSPQGTIQFRTNKVNYSGPQTFEVELIYLK